MHKRHRQERRKSGVFTSGMAILGNLVLFAIKLTVGLLSGSIAVIADGANDLLDSASSVIALFGFHASNRRRDAKYQHGYGRIEYISSLVVSITIIMTALSLGYMSVWEIVRPSPIDTTWWMVVLVIVTIAGNGLLALFYYIQNRKLESPLIRAAAKDSLNDMMSTSVTLLALVLAPVTDLPVDGIAGVGVSGLILFIGLKSFMESSRLLIGSRPEKDLASKIRRTVLGFDSFAKIVRMDFHDYGPTMREAIIMVELTQYASRGNLDRDIHDAKQILYGEYAVKTTIYWAP